ncbi:UNVERIFIED_CONTAM: hypothetical protein GTU68_013101 [Idotea baltica]|nr:hypothetical protein [Idotea baltica]
MHISRLFILKPVATTLTMIALLLSGIIAYQLLPISALPEVDYPTLRVLTTFPGASPDVVETTITAPLEQEFGQMAGLDNLSSNSSAGISVITLRFGLNIDLSVAEQEVQAAITAATNLLPSDLPAPPVYNKVNPADTPILTLAIKSNGLPLTKLHDLVDTRVAQKIAQTSGVGLVTLSGGQLPAVRITAQPTALATHKLNLEDIRSLITESNLNESKGNLDGPKRSVQLDANDQLKTAEQYRSLILKSENNAVLRLQDVASITNGSENDRLAAWANLNQAMLINVKKQPGANVIDVVDSVKALLPKLTSTLPKNIDVSILMDQTNTIRSAISDVQKELIFSIGLVILVTFLFLHKPSATIIPSIAVPLSLVGTLGVIYLAGFTINTLTLMALTIATGFVVDDAIVMLENIARYIEEGETPLNAALKGSKQIGFTLISLTLSLIAVLIPLLFMADVVGRLFREFAITLAVAIFMSLIISLTLTPMMCAKLLKAPKENHKENKFHQLTDYWLNSVINKYSQLLSWSLVHPKVILSIIGSTLLLTVGLYLFISKGFFPIQDTGQVIGFLRGDKSVSYQAMQPKIKQYRDSILQNPSVKSVAGFIGGRGGLTNSFLILRLKSRSERNLGVTEIINQLKKNFPKVPGAQLVLVPDQDLHVGKSQGGSSDNEYLLLSSDVDLLMKWLPKVANAFRELPELTDIDANGLGGTLQQKLIVNRSKAKKLGIDMSLVTGLLDNSFSERQISTIYKKSNEYQVVMELSHKYTQSEKILQQLKVITDEGTVVPLASFSHWESGLESDAVMHRGQFAAENIGFSLAKGVSLNQGINAIEKTIADLNLPIEIRGELGGTSALFKQTQNNQSWMILLAIGAVYLVLGVLYESYIHPITILSTLPSAGLGALVALEVFKSEFTLISLLGLFFLIGLVKKNAILMVDAALEFERNGNISPKEAIKKACLLRFRPILMTTLSALLGALPLVLSNADGSEIYKPLGITVIGGLIMSQFLTLYSTPVIYVYFDRMATRFSRKQNKASKVSI